MTAPRIALAVVLLALLAGCATAPEGSPVQARAAEANRRGLEQLRQGDAERARAAFEDALQLEQSIEHEAGIARAWYNLSVAYQRLGRDAEADGALDAVLLDDVHAFPPAQLTEVAFRKAVLAMARRDTAGATRALDRAHALCAGSCALAGAMLNLHARVALEERRFDDALVHLAQARSRNRRDPVESANTLRLQAAALIATGRLAEATLAAQAALDLDKRQGRSERIYQDLMLLAQAAAEVPARRRDFLMRAGDVARARGDGAGAARAEALLAATTIPTLPSTAEGEP